MRAPDFWWDEKPDFRASALAPLAALYGAVAARRMARRGVAVEAPVAVPPEPVLELADWSSVASL